MASNKTIVVLAPNGRRQNVKVTPHTTILQILEEVCKKQGLNSSDYDIKHHNQVLDTTVLMQFSGLPNNAQLELSTATKTRVESEVILGLQLESGTRLMGKFQPKDSLWEIISTLCPNELESENLVIIYMRQEIYGKENLYNATLRSLGVTGGRVMCRLIHRNPEELKIQANVSAPIQPKPVEEKPYKRTFKSDDSGSNTPTSSIQTPSQSSQTVSAANIAAIKSETPTKPSPNKVVKINAPPEKSTKTESGESLNIGHSHVPVRTTSSNEEVVFREPGEEIKFHKLGERNALAFTLEMAKSLPHEDLPDEFFDLTINDAKTLLQDLKRRRAEMEEQPLITSATRDLDKQKRILRNLNQYKRSVLRIQFPDRTVLQGTFKPIETIEDVIGFVREYLNDPTVNFHLYTTPPKTILSPSARLIEVDCVPCAVLHFGIEQPVEWTQYLRNDLLTKFSSYSGASLIASRSRGIQNTADDTNSDAMDEDDIVTYPEPHTTRNPQPTITRPTSNTEKVPKWFKPL
ncbi:tether containing UBX domain for GLUT4 [Chrysoperla carnea]|uniref:tether containing UBX domain for GLUT4 n=1 Tax=Chrysoperla carnea TaxID=189513 RepID=UPI001D06CC41|nr:tether containing UBX domain for GLUT4 [Chrysoperla carnea]